MTNSESKKINNGDLNPMKVADAPAFWITPGGRLFPAFYYHIYEVLERPVIFGLTKEKIEEIYSKFGEQMYHENGIPESGWARHEIVKSLLKKGWVTIRDSLRYAYVVEIHKITEKIKDYLWAWAVELIKEVSEGELDEEKKKSLIEEKRKARILLEDEYQSKEVTLGFLADDLLKNENERFNGDRALLMVLENAGQVKEELCYTADDFLVDPSINKREGRYLLFVLESVEQLCDIWVVERQIKYMKGLE